MIGTTEKLTILGKENRYLVHVLETPGAFKAKRASFHRKSQNVMPPHTKVLHDDNANEHASASKPRDASKTKSCA
jgi:hypothetical protein